MKHVILFITALALISPFTAQAVDAGSRSVAAKKKEHSSRAKKSSTGSRVKSAAKTADPRLKQDIAFDNHAVGGKYQVPMESMTVIEDEKTLDDLIGVRQNFRDRLQSSKELR